MAVLHRYYGLPTTHHRGDNKPIPGSGYSAIAKKAT
jgi:hypothetical protein